MRRTLILAVLMIVLSLPTVSLAQDKPDMHFDFGWRAWFVTVRSAAPTSGIGGTIGNEKNEGIMSGPIASLDFDRKWALGVAYLSTDLGKGIDPSRNQVSRSFEKDTTRSDLDMSLRYRLLDWLGIYLSFKRLDFEVSTVDTADIDRGSIQGVGFGAALSHHIWSPSDKSSLFLSGSAAYFPLSWVDSVTRDPDNTVRSKPNWFTAEAGIGYSRPVGPLLGSLIAGYRYQTFGLETNRGGSDRHFSDLDFDFFGPTLTLNLRW